MPENRRDEKDKNIDRDRQNQQTPRKDLDNKNQKQGGFDKNRLDKDKMIRDKK